MFCYFNAPISEELSEINLVEGVFWCYINPLLTLIVVILLFKLIVLDFQFLKQLDSISISYCNESVF